MKTTDHYFSEKPLSEFKIEKFKAVLRGINLEFYTSPGVFSKKTIDKGTKLLIETMVIFDGWKVLDLGCGYGDIGIVAAKLNPSGEVFMSDINERALELAKLNLQLNNVNNAKIIKSNLFENIKEEFDAIITNPPYTTGKDIIKKIVEESYNHLKSKGIFQVVTTQKFKYIEEFLKQVFDEVLLLAKEGNYLTYAGLKY